MREYTVPPPESARTSVRTAHLSKRFPPRKAAPGPYKVVSQLPERDGQLQYRIKSGCEPFYRTVSESELAELELERTKKPHNGREIAKLPALASSARAWCAKFLSMPWAANVGLSSTRVAENRGSKYARAIFEKNEGDMPKTVKGKLVDFVLKLEEPRQEVMVEMLALAIENLTDAYGPEKMAANLRHIVDELDENAKLIDVKPGSQSKH